MSAPVLSDINLFNIKRRGSSDSVLSMPDLIYFDVLTYNGTMYVLNKSTSTRVEEVLNHVYIVLPVRVKFFGSI